MRCCPGEISQHWRSGGKPGANDVPESQRKPPYGRTETEATRGCYEVGRTNVCLPGRHHRIDDHRALHADLQDLRPDQVDRSSTAGPGSLPWPAVRLTPRGWSAIIYRPQAQAGRPAHRSCSCHRSCTGQTRHTRRKAGSQSQGTAVLGPPSCLGRHPTRVPRGTGGAVLNFSVLKGLTSDRSHPEVDQGE